MSEDALHNSSSLLRLRDLGTLYNQQNNVRSPVSDMFWSQSNLVPLVDSIDRALSRNAGFPISIAIDDVFFFMTTRHVTTAAYSPGYESLTVQNLNGRVFDEQLKVHGRQLKRKALFDKYFIYQDRAKYMPPPRDTHGRHRIAQPSAEAYYLGDPDSKEWCKFQEELKKHRNDVKTPALFSIYD